MEWDPTTDKIRNEKRKEIMCFRDPKILILTLVRIIKKLYPYVFFVVYVYCIA